MVKELHCQKLNEAVILSNSSESSASSNTSAEIQPSRKSKNHNFKVTNTAAASIRFGVSQRATAAITSGFLQDLVAAGYLTEEENNFLICDPKNIYI